MPRKQKYIENNEKCKQAVILVRVSSEDQEKGASKDAQKEATINYCEKEGFEILEQDRFIFTESSTRGPREQFYDMIEFVKQQKKKTAIVVHCVDRLQRSSNESPILDELRKEGRIEIHFIKENITIKQDSVSSDIMIWDIFVMLAKNYTNNISDNVKRSKNYLYSKGIWSGLAPVGYKNISKTSDTKAHIEIDDVYGPMVRRLFEEYSTGKHTLKSLELLAKAMGLKTYMKKKKNPNCTLSRNQIWNVLQNPFYYGEMLVKGKLIPHIYEPLIDRQLFNICQDILKGKARVPFKLGYKKIPFIFRGLMKCGTCGCTISPEAHERNGKRYVILRCTRRKDNCKQELVNENVILDQLHEEIFKNIKVPEKALNEIKAGIKDYVSKETGHIKNIQKNIATQLTTLKGREEALFNKFLDNEISKERHDSKLESLKKERADLEESYKKYELPDSETIKTMTNIVEIAAGAGNLMACSDNLKKNELLRLIFTSTTLSGLSACYSLKKPFDSLLKSKGCNTWLGWLDSNQRHTD